MMASTVVDVAKVVKRCIIPSSLSIEVMLLIALIMMILRNEFMKISSGLPRK